VTTIRELSAVTSLNAGDQVPLYAPSQGNTRKFSLTTLVEFLSTAFTSFTASSYIATTSTTVAGLPSAATAGAGARAMVTDATATTFNSVVAGGGANIVPVFSDGTNWRIG
jgi:hypothetical protein